MNVELEEVKESLVLYVRPAQIMLEREYMFDEEKYQKENSVLMLLSTGDCVSSELSISSTLNRGLMFAWGSQLGLFVGL